MRQYLREQQAVRRAWRVVLEREIASKGRLHPKDVKPAVRHPQRLDPFRLAGAGDRHGGPLPERDVLERLSLFTVDEVIDVTINFYRRNYIEGLFLSSGIFDSPDYTMERLVRIAKKLRKEHNFNGYIHLKAIPGASQELIKEAGLYADRLSVNIEIPSELKVTTAQEKGKNPEITLTGIDRQLIGAVAAKIRSLRKPEPYKGKGVRYQGEVVRKKAGKAAGK